MIPKNIADDFYAGKTNELIKFSINDSVKIIGGKYKGQNCAVISIEKIEPKVEYHLELGVDGSSVIVPQDMLESIKKE